MKLTSNAVILRGVLTVIFGIVAMAWPVTTVVSFALLWGIYALVDAVTTFGVAFSSELRAWPRIALILLGVVGLIAGLLVIFRPVAGVLILTWVLGIWLIAHGILTLASAFAPALQVSRWLLVASGLLSLIAGILIAANPGRSAIGLTVWLGVFAVLWGITTVAAGFALRRVEKEASAPVGEAEVH